MPSNLQALQVTPSGVGNGIVAERAAWTFGGNVADTFVDHIKKSVPHYDLGHDLVCKLSDFFIRDRSTVYELGVSTGELLRKLAAFHDHRDDVRYIGIDCEESMIEAASEHCDGFRNIDFICRDLSNCSFTKTDFMVSYYTIQFLPPATRQPLCDKIYNALNWGGAFVLFEKVRAPDARFQDMMTALYDDFKGEQGFDDSEIMSKKRSLRGVLEPYTSAAQLEFLYRAGFKDVMPIMKSLCFEGFLAIK